MIMGYYRLGRHEDARRSMKKMLDYARRFRMDNPLIDFGNDVYQPGVPINCVYDNWGVPAAMIRGLYEYVYSAEGLKIVPQIPSGITQIEQRFPIRFGPRRIYLRTTGSGPVTAVRVNNKAWELFGADSVFLPDDGRTPKAARVEIARGGALLGGEWQPDLDRERPPASSAQVAPQREPLLERISKMQDRLVAIGAGESYEAQHARLALACAATVIQRERMQAEGRLQPLADAVSQAAADQSYRETVSRLAQGLQEVLDAYERSDTPHQQRVHAIWQDTR